MAQRLDTDAFEYLYIEHIGGTPLKRVPNAHRLPEILGVDGITFWQIIDARPEQFINAIREIDTKRLLADQARTLERRPRRTWRQRLAGWLRRR